MLIFNPKGLSKFHERLRLKDIFNPAIMSVYEKKIAQCEQLLQYEFKNKLFCLEALQTSGNPLNWENGLRVIPKNENLAVLGDVVMKAHLCMRWYSTGRAKGRSPGNRPRLLSNHFRAMGGG